MHWGIVVKNISFNFTKQTVKRGAGRALMAVFCILVALMIALGAAASTFLPVYAAEYTAYDRSAIEDDLKEIDIAAYPADAEGRHFLLDDVGFMEYGYSESGFIAQNYFGIYLYLYNPTEREISTRAGANVVNMATYYNVAGEPTSYENVEITVLDHTDNYRYYKFKIADSKTVYERACAYARGHDGVRRYDIASIQVWFLGDQNATDSFTERNEQSVTYRCTGYAAGCGADSNAESTLEIRRDTLESVELDVQKTFWRTQTSSLGAGHQNQLDTVYFTVPQELFDEYGTLQRIRAEWWEYKTKPILVTSDETYYTRFGEYIGYQLGEDNEDENIPFFFYTEADMHTTGLTSYKGYLWNRESEGYSGDYELGSIYYLFPTKDWVDISEYDPKADIEESGGISTNALEEYIFGYDKTFDSGELNVKDGRVISADLFEADIDESRKVDNGRGKIQKGYSYYDFDVEEDVQEIVSWEDGDPSWWDNWQEFGFWDSVFGDIPKEEGRSFSPIYIPKGEDFNGSAEEIADRLMCQVSDVESIREAYQTEGQVLVMFRFATSDYVASNVSVRNRSVFEDNKIQSSDDWMYIAQESVFLNFDVIQLTFKSEAEKMTVIPVVANPIDIIDPITPPTDFSNEDFWKLVWILAGLALGTAAVGIIGTIIGKIRDKEVK